MEDIDIHNREQRIKSLMARIKASDILDENKEAIYKYKKYCEAQGLTVSRVEKLTQSLYQLAKEINKPFSKFKKEDIINLMAFIEKSKWSDWTKSDFKKIFKRFYYKFLKGCEDYPSEAKLIKAKEPGKKIKAKDLLTVDEVRLIASSTENPMYRALVLAMVERGIEVGAILTCRISDLRFDENGCWLYTRCKKTKYRERDVRLINSSPALRQWYDVLKEKLKDKENIDDMPLWVDNNGSSLKYQTFRKWLKKSAKSCGIKKRVYPHLLRHTGITEMIKQGIPESVIKAQVGHSPKSNVIADYISLASSDVDDALLEANGIKKKDTKKVLRKRVCLRCHEENSPEKETCTRCGTLLDPEKLFMLEEKRHELEQKIDSIYPVLKMLGDNPELIDQLPTLINKLGKK
jgi:integrase